MKVLMKSKGMKKEELYKLVAPETFVNMSDEVGNEIEVKKFSLHVEEDDWNERKKVLAIENETGEIIVSASRSFIRDFEKIMEIFGTVEKVLVTSDKTNNGYEVIGCRFVK